MMRAVSMRVSGQHRILVTCEGIVGIVYLSRVGETLAEARGRAQARNSSARQHGEQSAGRWVVT
jgi:hypothetical protein